MKIQNVIDLFAHLGVLAAVIVFALYLSGCTGEVCMGMKNFDTAHDSRSLSKK